MHGQAPGMPSAAARGARGGGATRMKNPLKPPRFSKNMNGATQSQVRRSSPPSHRAQLNLFQDNPSLTQGGTISQPYPVSQSGLMSQHAYGLSQQDFSQPVFTRLRFLLVTRFRWSLSLVRIGYVRCVPTVAERTSSATVAGFYLC